MSTLVLETPLHLGQQRLLFSLVLLGAVLLRQVMLDHGLELEPILNVSLGKRLVELEIKELHRTNDWGPRGQYSLGICAVLASLVPGLTFGFELILPTADQSYRKIREIYLTIGVHCECKCDKKIVEPPPQNAP